MCPFRIKVAATTMFDCNIKLVNEAPQTFRLHKDDGSIMFKILEQINVIGASTEEGNKDRMKQRWVCDWTRKLKRP